MGLALCGKLGNVDVEDRTPLQGRVTEDTGLGVEGGAPGLHSHLDGCPRVAREPHSSLRLKYQHSHVVESS